MQKNWYKKATITPPAPPSIGEQQAEITQSKGNITPIPQPPSPQSKSKPATQQSNPKGVLLANPEQPNNQKQKNKPNDTFSTMMGVFPKAFNMMIDEFVNMKNKNNLSVLDPNLANTLKFMIKDPSMQKKISQIINEATQK